jgi:hypothetical protein
MSDACDLNLGQGRRSVTFELLGCCSVTMPHNQLVLSIRAAVREG